MDHFFVRGSLRSSTSLHSFLVHCSLKRGYEANNGLEALPDEVELALKTSLNREAVIQSGLATVDAERDKARTAVSEFEQSFFPTQSKALRAIRIALATLILGFVQLGAAYILAHYNLTFPSSELPTPAAEVRH